MEIGERNHLMQSHMKRRKAEQIPGAHEMTGQQKTAQEQEMRITTKEPSAANCLFFSFIPTKFRFSFIVRRPIFRVHHKRQATPVADLRGWIRPAETN